MALKAQEKKGLNENSNKCWKIDEKIIITPRADLAENITII